jgi:hypothetical protein
MWIKLSTHGRTVWVNESLVRRIESDYGSGSKLYYTSKDCTSVDQSSDEVLTAMGYQLPPKQTPETHETDVGEATFEQPKPPLTYAALVEKALNEANRPLKLEELCDYIAKHRLTNNKSVASTLLQNGRFCREANGTWWFVDRSIPFQVGTK